MPQEVDEASQKPTTAGDVDTDVNTDVDTDVSQTKKTGVKTRRVAKVVSAVGTFMSITIAVN